MGFSGAHVSSVLGSAAISRTDARPDTTFPTICHAPSRCGAGPRVTMNCVPCSAIDTHPASRCRSVG